MVVVENMGSTVGKVVPHMVLVNMLAQVFHSHHDIRYRNSHPRRSLETLLYMVVDI